jgi:hypothetical protein
MRWSGKTVAAILVALAACGGDRGGNGEAAGGKGGTVTVGMRNDFQPINPITAGDQYTIELINYALYQIGWFDCVLGAASYRPWAGFLIGVILVGVHLAPSVERALEVRLLVLATAVGAVVETTQIAAATYRFTSGTE